MTGLLDRILDASVVLSFDRTGYARHARHFETSDERPMAGIVCLVTGANAGLGMAAARGLARRGARVRLLCRSEARGRDAEAVLRRELPDADLAVDLVDVSDLASVRGFATRLEERKVDVLVHNAGVLPPSRQESADGLELAFATNVIGPHLLTRLLEEKLLASEDGRAIFVSSGGMYSTKLSCSDVAWRRRPYDGVRAYAQTKRMQVVLAELWAERWRGSSGSAHAMHPGWADTEGVRGSIPRFHALTRAILRTPEQGADTIVWLAAARRERIGSGRFWFDRAERATHLLPWTREGEAERRRLWRLCEEKGGLAGARERSPH